MKARIIKTGEEVTVIAISKKSGTVQYYGSDGICHQCKFNDKEIEFINTTGAQSVDWEQRRYEIAKDVLAASFAQPMSAVSLPSYAHICVQWADVLIDELKKKANVQNRNDTS
ncbi:hypothetical protein [Hoylesella buccalis]|uniref:hypothetical protein n=1 Tax=Hoylesella buccalis TaxID=28127 RepID=UPI00058E789A|nr:hypothetical protein [Hoylesella buccalis]